MCHVKVTLNRHKNASNLAGNSAAILWDYFQGGGMFTKIMKTCKIERLRAYWSGFKDILHSALSFALDLGTIPGTRNVRIVNRNGPRH